MQKNDFKISVDEKKKNAMWDMCGGSERAVTAIFERISLDEFC